MIIELAPVAIKPEQRETWLMLVRQNAAETRAEEGCESYQIGEDIETPNIFVIVERSTDLKLSTSTSEIHDSASR